MAPKLRLGKKHVAGEVSPPITDHSAPSESHGERMARSSLKKAAESLPEMDWVLGQLPKAVKEFTTAYSELSSDALLEGPPNLDPAKALRQVVWHFRDLSWRTSIHPEQAEKLCKIFVEPLNVMQVVVSEVGSLDLQACLNKSSSASLLGAYLLALDVSTLYCVLASSFGVPVTLVVEEVSFGIVKCLKEILRQAITPMLSSDERSRKGAQHDTGDLPFSAEEGSTLCGAVADLMQALHEFVSRHKLGEDQLHQLIHMSLSVFFFAEPHFRLCQAAEEMLVTIFSRHSPLRSSVLQEFLSRAPRLPSGKRAKKFQLPASEDSAAYGLSTWTHLLLRLCQSSCLPLREPIGSNMDFEAVLQQKPALQTVIAPLMAGLLQRLVLSRSKDEEARGILEDFVEELLNAAFKPMWPAAVSLLRYLLQQLIALLQEKKQAGDITVREFALKLLSRAEVRLWHHAVQTAQDVTRLPPWTQAPDDVPKELRLLQHIALRVSLEDGRDLPWTYAARAVEAWDAELFLAKGATDAQTQGLRSFSDDIVFLHLTMAFLADECLVPLLLPPTMVLDAGGATPIASAPASPLSACVFDASHPVHAWSFLVCDLAEAQQEAPEEGKKRKPIGGTPLQRFLASAWCSPTLVCDTASWRGVGGRRVLLPYTVYKVYRQLRSSELDLLRRAALDCIIMQANSPQASLRKTAMRALSELVDMDISVLTLRPVEETVEMRLRDESSWVRQVTLDLLGRILEGSLSTEANSGEVTPRLLSMESSEAMAKAMLLRFHKTVRGRVNDTAVIVRRQATKILSAFVLNHPDHPDVIPVTLDLLRRSTDSDALRNLVMGTFELLWFMDDEPTPEAAKQLSRVVDASRAMSTLGDILNELLRRFRKTIGSRKNSKGYEFAIRRWTTLILNEFVQLRSGKPARVKKVKLKGGGMKQEPAPAESPEEQWHMRRSLLSTLEAFATAQPKDLLVHLRPLTIYLALEDTSTPEEQWVAIKVCRILSSVLPYVAERRGLMDHRQVQADLQALIRSQPSSGVHEAVRCLCLVVKYVTGDLPQIVTHLNVAVPSLSKLCSIAEQKPGSLDRIQIMYMSRQAWVLSSILETLSVDDYVDSGLSKEPKRRLLPRSELKFDFVGNSVAGTVADLLLRLNELGEPQLRAVAASCMGFFLKGQRTYTKDPRISELLSGALSSGDLLLCRRALETLSTLLGFFRNEAEKESKANAADFADSRDGQVLGHTDGKASKTNSAIEAAQPLAAFSDQVLAHITLAGSVGPAALKPKKPPKRSRSGEHEEDLEAQRAESVLRVRVEALAVARHLHQQGLVNPMTVLPKVFALAFASEWRLSEPATTMLKEMLELRPQLLLNRLEESFRESFIALLCGFLRLGEVLGTQQLAGLGEVYAERFRKQKALRDGFLRKALQQLQKVPTGQCEDRFAELAALGVIDDEEALRKESVAAAQQLPLRQRQQLLYSQFIAGAISSLPFNFESEPLLLIYECNHHISLHAGTLLASFEGENTPKDPPPPEQVFLSALSVVTSVVLKSVMKREYNLSAEQCATFNPRDIRQERIGRSMAMFQRDKEEGAGTNPVRNRFPAAEWLEKVMPLVKNFSNSPEIVAYIWELTDADPWDDSRARHEHKLSALEGRRTRGSRAAAGAAQAATPSRAGRKPKTKMEPKKKGRRRGYESDEDSDYEAPNRKRPRARAREAAPAADEESDLEPQDVD